MTQAPMTAVRNRPNAGRWVRVLMALLALAVPQSVASFAQTPAVVVSVEGSAPVTMTLDELKGLPVHSVQAVDVKEEIRYEGAAVADILMKAGLTFGQTMRGDRLQLYLLVEASDGFRVVYALPELDSQFSEAVTIIAYQRNGRPLPEADGAFRFVHSTDKRHARWVRKVTGLKVLRAGG